MKEFFPTNDGWTKEKIFNQLSPLYDSEADKEIPINFTAEDMSDEAVQEWVNKHQTILGELLSEDRYCDKVIGINDELIIKTLGKDPRQ